MALGLTWWFTRSAEEVQASPQPPVLTRVTTDAGLTYQPALSKDGKLLAYASDRAEDGNDGNMDIWVQQVGSSEAIGLTDNDASDEGPTFSPDGRQIAFYSTRGASGMYTISTLGGQEKLIMEGCRNARYSPDGEWIVCSTGTAAFAQMYVVPTAGGTPRQLAEDFRFARAPIWSPDGQFILFNGFDLTTGEKGERDWWTVLFEGGTPEKTGVFASFKNRFGGRGGFVNAGAWLPDGNVLFSGPAGDSTNHYCPVRSRIESAGWGDRVSFHGSLMAARPVKWAFSQIG